MIKTISYDCESLYDEFCKRNSTIKIDMLIFDKIFRFGYSDALSDMENTIHGK